MNFQEYEFLDNLKTQHNSGIYKADFIVDLIYNFLKVMQLIMKCSSAFLFFSNNFLDVNYLYYLFKKHKSKKKNNVK